MDFSEVENLRQEDIMGMYDDIAEFDDDTRLAGCCCATVYSYGLYYRETCRAWCRGQGRSCTGWDYSYAGYACGFRC